MSQWGGSIYIAVMFMFEKMFQRRLKRIERRGERQKQKYELEEKYAEYYPGKKRKVSNVMLTIIVIMIIGYAVADFILQYYVGYEISSTLTTCWFSFWGAEICALTGIKISKVFKNNECNNFSEENQIIDDDESVG